MILQPALYSRGKLFKLEGHCFRDGKPVRRSLELPSTVAPTGFSIDDGWLTRGKLLHYFGFPDRLVVDLRIVAMIYYVLLKQKVPRKDRQPQLHYLL